MRRPLILIMSMFSAGIAIQYYLKTSIVILSILLITSVLVFFVSKKEKIDYGVYLLIFLIFGSMLFNIVESKESAFNKYINEKVQVIGVVREIRETDNEKYIAEVDIKEIISEDTTTNTNEKVRLEIKGKLEAPFSIVGKYIKIEGIAQEPSGKRNPNTFDYKLYLKTTGISTIIKSNVEDIQITEDISTLDYYIAQLKYSFIESATANMSSDTAGILSGILFGEKDLISEDIYEDFQKNGIAHILAVSGIHVGIIFGFLSILIRIKNKAIKDALIILILAAYIVMANFSPSVVRAVLMIVIYTVSKHLHRKYDLLSSLFLVGFIFTLLNPYTLFNVGFQLSFTVVLVISLIDKYVKNNYDSKPLRAVVMLFAAQIGGIPITIYYFNYIAIWAFLINIPIIFLAGIVIPLGFTLMIIFNFFNGISKVLFKAEEMLLNIIIKTVGFVSNNTMESLKIVSISLVAVLVIYLLIIFITYDKKPKLLERFKKEIIVIFIFVIIVSISMNNVLLNKYEITFIDVGQGDSILIKTANKNILIDSGGSLDNSTYDIGEKVLLPYLYKNGINRIDHMIISHLHEDHYNGILSIIDDIKVKEYMLSSVEKNNPNITKIEEAAKNNNSKIKYLNKGDRITIEKDIYFDVLYPSTKDLKKLSQNDGNNSSLVLLLNYKGTKILFTGDIEKEAEEIMLEDNNNLDVDFIKIPHHGSRTSSTEKFIDSTNAEFGIIQVGRNNYGLPNQEVIDRHEENETKVYRTDYNGAILVDITNDGFVVKEMISE